jgi:hemerythrin
MKIEWDKKFEIGHDRIDSEHRIFLGLILELDRRVDAAEPHESLLRTIREIEAYARFHFLSEENIMIDLGYPELESHRAEHRMLLASIEDRVYGFSRGDSTAAEIVTYTFEWFALHTTQVDKKIAAYIDQQRGR